MYRRVYLAGASAGIGAVLSGCLGGDGGLDQGEVRALDAWFQAAVDVVDRGQLRVSAWFEEPGSVELSVLSSLESDAETLSTRWTEEVDPKLGGLSNTDIDRTVGNETWLVEGGAFVDVLEDLKWGVDAVQTGAGALVAADGDPDQLDEDDRATLEELTEEGPQTTDAAVELWFRDALDE